MLIFACIAFIFGIHADIFSSYDKLNSKLENTYDWFNPKHVIQFPFDQYQINVNKKNEHIDLHANIDLQELYFSKQIDPKYFSQRFSIVIDKTPSTIKEENQNIKKSITDITEELTQSSGKNGIDLTNIELEDLIVLSAIHQLGQQRGKKIEVEIMYYYGNSFFSSPFNDKKIIDSGNVNQTVRELAQYCIDSVNTKTAFFKRKQNIYTDFTKIIDKLKEKNWIGPNDDPGHYNNLFLISDFIHDAISDSPFFTLSERLQSFNATKIEQINLVQIPTTFTTEQNEQKLKTIELFRESYNHLYYYESEEFFTSTNSISSQIACIFSSVVYNENACVNLYNSWNNSTYQYDYHNCICFKNIGNNKKIFIGIGNSENLISYSDKNGYLFFEDQDKKIYPFQSLICEFDNNKCESVVFTTSKFDSKNYYLDINDPDKAIKIRIPIVLRQVLPKTSCFYLILLYPILFISLLFAFFYLFFCLVVDIIGSETMPKPLKIASSVLIAGLVASVFVLFAIIIDPVFSQANYLQGGYLHCYVGLLLFLFIFYPRFMYYSVRRHLKKRNTEKPPRYSSPDFLPS